MIDKRVKNAAPSRKGDGAPRAGSGREQRQDLPIALDRQDEPRRTSGGAKDVHASKPALQRKPKPRKPETKPPRDPETGMRIAKVMARAGLCSRRDAETWIEQGRVFLNGKVLGSPAINIGPQDQVSVDGVPLAARERTRLFLFHKPRGLVTTDKDPEGRPTIFDHLQRNWPDGPRVIAVGRLDINTEGLLLLTNDGGLARVLELPSTGWTRRYRVRANGKTDQSILDRLRDGLTLDGIDYAGIDAKLDRVQGDNVWMSLALSEGKNREIKRVLEHINLFVNRLIRISFGPFQLGELAEGAVEEVRTRVLRDQLGPKLASEADADFESPLAELPKEPILLPQRGAARNGAKQAERIPRGKREARDIPDRKAPPRSRNDRPETGRDRKPVPARGVDREAPAPLKQSKIMKRDRLNKLERDAGEKPVSTFSHSALEPSFKPRGPRKHISAMRNTGAAKAAQGERKRTLLSETADRKGRTVVVERKAKAAPRKPREEPFRTEQEDRKARASTRSKTPKPYGAPGKPRNAAQAPEWQDATQPPKRFKSPAKNPSLKGANSKSRKPGPGRPRAARPAKPGRPQRPR
jgi:23S rRNA pseudouridine2605 synthase